MQLSQLANVEGAEVSVSGAQLGSIVVKVHLLFFAEHWHAALSQDSMVLCCDMTIGNLQENLAKFLLVLSLLAHVGIEGDAFVKEFVQMSTKCIELGGLFLLQSIKWHHDFEVIDNTKYIDLIPFF